MRHHLIRDAHEWINEIPTVPIYYLAKTQPRERAWQQQQGKKTLLSLTLVWLCEKNMRGVEYVRGAIHWLNTTTLIVFLLIQWSRAGPQRPLSSIKIALLLVDPTVRLGVWLDCQMITQVS